MKNNIDYRQKAAAQMLMNNLDPEMMKCMVALVNNPNEEQKQTEEYFKLQIEKDFLDKRYKFSLRKQFFLEERVKQLEGQLRANNSNMFTEILNVLEDLVYIDPCEADFIDTLKNVQNSASWCITRYGYLVDGAVKVDDFDMDEILRIK